MSVWGIGLYVSDSIAAVEMYKRAFGLTLGYHVLNKDGTYFHSQLYKGEEEVLSVVQSDSVQLRADMLNPVELGYTFETKDELLAAKTVLENGGKVVMDVCELPWSPCATVISDRFGIRWYLTLQQVRPADDFSPDDIKQH